MGKAIVIGSGVAGLASAIRLRAKGYVVDVFEANSYPGGKLTEVEVDGFRFDAGPSLFTLPVLVDNVIRAAGEDPREHLKYFKREVVCNYFWEDGTQFSASADAEKFASDAEGAFDVKAAEIKNYLKHAEKMYRLTTKVFLERSLHKASTYLSMDAVIAITNIFGMNLTKTLDEVNRKRLADPKLVQLFNRFATYNGSSPFLAPGIFTMVPHLEHNVGAFFPEGGMHSITKALYNVALKKGVNFHFNKRVNEILIEKGRAGGVKAEKVHKANIVISNMDVVPSYRKLMPKSDAPEQTLEQERSSSALIFYWGIKAQFPELDLHNIFFSNNYKEEFSKIFQSNEVGEDPTVYIHVSSKAEIADAPEGCENWFVMVNVPSNKGQNWDEIIDRTRKNVISKLGRILHRDIEPLIACEEQLDPIRIEEKMSSHQGALYGASSNSKFSAFLRHPNFQKKVKGLYFCGGSVHPGGGIPLCLLSAKITAELIPDPTNEKK